MRSALKEFQENLNFYHTHLQFNPPYPVLLDASFICSIVANGVDDIVKHLLETYGRKFKFFYTTCILHHLECHYPNNVHLEEIMNKMRIYPCSHAYSAPTSTYDCIYGIACQNQYKKVIGPPRCKKYIKEKEPRLMVATQNLNLVENLRAIIAVPLMYFNKGRVVIERPSEVTLKMIQNSIHRKQEMIGMEVEILAHAVEDKEMEASKQAKGNCDAADTGEKKGERQSSSKSTKRKRDASPDICDTSGRIRNKKKKVEGFEMYKTLCRRETDSVRPRKLENRIDNRGNRGQSTSIPKPPYLTNSYLFTNTSSFEFDTNDNQQR